MTTTTTYLVSGMTCGHCVAAVTEEVGKLDGVQRGRRRPGRRAVESRVTVTSTAPLSASAVARGGRRGRLRPGRRRSDERAAQFTPRRPAGPGRRSICRSVA